VVAVDYNRREDTGRSRDPARWSFAAALLKPPVPKAVEISPMPKKK